MHLSRCWQVVSRASVAFAFAGLMTQISCGGGGGSTPSTPAPTITSFTAATSRITVGTATTLTGVFENGTGTVDQGVGTLTSGAAKATANLSTDTTFTLTVTGASGTATKTTTVAVVPAPNATITAPAYVTTSQAGFTASVADQVGSSYAWSVLSGGGSITAGTTSHQITFTAGPVGTMQLQCIVTNSAATSDTKTTSISVVALPDATITAPASTITGTTGLTASVPNQTGTTFAWTITGGTITAGAGTRQITFTAGAAGNLALHCAVTNAAGTSAGGDATVSVTASLSIQTQPTSQTATAPDGASFSVVAGGIGPFTYQWKRNGTAISGATGNTFQTDPTDLKTVPDSYSVVVGNGATTLESSTVSFTVVAPNPFYPAGGQPVPVPSRPLTVIPSLHVDAAKFPNGAFRLGYDEAIKNPAWTAYADFKVGSTFANSTGDYQTDIRLAAPQVTPDAMGTHGSMFYLSNGQGFDRGHQVPRADLSYRYGPQAGDDATYMSNMVAQVSYFNQRLWNDLEEAIGGKLSGSTFTNGLTAIFGRVWIYTGPIFPTSIDYWVPSTSTYTKTPGALAAGTLTIAIPTACFKVVVAEPSAGQTLPRVMAWMSSNRSYATSESADIWKYTTSVKRVEELTGLDLFPGLPHDAALTTLKASVDVRGWGTDFEKSTGPNVHMLKPSWDLVPISTNPILKGETVKTGDQVSFEAAVTPNKTGGTVDTTAGCTWTFGDNSATSTGLTATHVYSAVGSYTVTFSATDSLSKTNAITRVVTVVDGTNAPPTVTPSTLPNVSIRLGNPVAPVTFTVADDNTPAGSLVVTATSSNQALLPDSQLVVANVAGAVSLAITPAVGQLGTSTITVRVTDEAAASTTKTFTFTVAANTAPTFTPATLPDVSTTTGTAKLVQFTVADDATPAGSITVAAVSGNQVLLKDSNIAVSNVSGAITLTLTPEAGQIGTALITVTATDSEAAATVKTFTFTVAAPSSNLLETFESGTKTAYATADVVFSSGTWTLNDALVGTTAGSDRFNGTKSIRLRNGAVTMKFDFPNGAQTVTIQHAKYGTDANGAWGLWYSTNQGGTWTQVGSAVTSTSTTLTPAVFPVNIPGPIRLEIRKTDGLATTRVCLDDFQITGY